MEAVLKKQTIRKPPKSKARKLAEKFLKFRRRLRASDDSVDSYFRRGETTGRFYHFS